MDEQMNTYQIGSNKMMTFERNTKLNRSKYLE